MAWMHHIGRSRRGRLEAISTRMLFTCLMLISGTLFFTPQSFANSLNFTFVNFFSLPLSLGGDFMLSTTVQKPITPKINNEEISPQNNIINLQEKIKDLQEKLDFVTGMKQRLPLEGSKLVIADIRQRTINENQATLIINRGTEDGVSSGQYVFAYNCIIGRIETEDDIGPKMARVRLFSDAESSIGVRIGDLDVPRIMQGSGNLSAKINELQTTHDIEVGDSVIACKLPGLLDVPTIIGRIAKAEPDAKNPIVWDITVQPACVISNIDQVAVLIMDPKD